MRVHRLTFAALAVAAGLTLTACQNGEGSPAQGGPSSAPTTSTAPTPGGGSGTASAAPNTGKASADTGKASPCRTADLEITALDSTIGGDTGGSVAVTLKNRAGRDCTLSEYAGVDLKTSAGPLSAKRTGEHPGPAVLKKGEAISFGVTYPLNTSGGSGVRITGLVVTPPDETKSVTLAWPGAATLPVTEDTGSPVKVGPIGSAGQGG